MTISVLFGSRKAGKIGELQLDATLRETHIVTNEVTQYPVEDGADISDNIRLVPLEVEMNGFITNSPVDILQANNAEVIEQQNGEIEIKNLKRTEVINRVELAVDILYQIAGRKVRGKQEDPQLVTIVSGLRVYNNMAIKSLNIPRETPSEEAIRFNASFIEVNFVDSESNFIPNPATDINTQNNTQSTINKKKQTPKKPLTSTLRKGADSLDNFLKSQK